MSCKSRQPFAKAIYGDAFVPVRHNDISPLIGVCREVLARTGSSWAGYAAQDLTPYLRNKLDMVFESEKKRAGGKLKA